MNYKEFFTKIFSKELSFNARITQKGPKCCININSLKLFPYSHLKANKLSNFINPVKTFLNDKQTSADKLLAATKLNFFQKSLGLIKVSDALPDLSWAPLMDNTAASSSSKDL